MAGIFISNLPYNVTEKELSQLIQSSLSTVDGDFNIRLFASQDGRRTAVADGFSSDLTKIIELLQGLQLKNKTLRVKYDRGDERDDFGKFVKPLPAFERRKLQHLVGDSPRKIQIFKSSFVSGFEGAFNFQTPKAFVYLNRHEKSLFETAGTIQMFDRFRRRGTEYGEDFYILMYSNILETVQAISLLNNVRGATGRIIFTDLNGVHASTLDRKSGIGKGGTVLDINAVGKIGYIPLEQFDSAIIDNSVISCLTGQCWRCVSAGRKCADFVIKGICANLNYFVGKCSCNYELESPVMDIDRPFRHGQEEFTRLTLSSLTKGHKKNLMVVHDPFKLQYGSPEEYFTIAGPILFDNWKTYSTSFKNLNLTRCASIKFFQHIETLTTEKDVQLEVFHIELVVPTNKFWRPESIKQIRNVTLFADVNVPKQTQRLRMKEIRKGKVTGIFAEGLTTTVYLRIQLSVGCEPLQQDGVKMVPKPIKLEYETTIRTLNQWTKGKLKTPQLDIILSPNSVKLAPIRGFYQINMMNTLVKRKVLMLHESLNAEQRLALLQTKSSSIQVVQGPPGTGKTHWIATVASILSLTESGKILLCAPSNEAADNLAVAFKKVSTSFQVRKRVCRVYARALEAEELRCNFNSMEEYAIDSLHWNVQNHPEYLGGAEFQQIKLLLQKQQAHLLKTDQIKTLDAHKAKLEHSMLDQFDIIVSTTGCLADFRILSWNNQKKLSTLIIDEIGQTKQTDLPFLLGIGQRRTCLVGDHLQLKPHVSSFAAKLAGLDISCLQWLEIGGKQIPWTMLLEQHRMAPKIRELTSHVTYNGLLRDSPLILERKDVLPDSLYAGYPSLKDNDVIIYDHSFPEQKDDTGSVYNKQEAELIANIAIKLCREGLDPSKLSVLTFYEAQKSLISSRLQNLQQVKVANVDAYQGKENHVILLSLSRSNKDDDIGFARSANRLNVAISRAKYKMIICCNLSLFSNFQNNVWKNFSSKIKDCALVKKIANYNAEIV